jgi:hypothetical protein
MIGTKSEEIGEKNTSYNHSRSRDFNFFDLDHAKRDVSEMNGSGPPSVFPPQRIKTHQEAKTHIKAHQAPHT